MHCRQPYDIIISDIEPILLLKTILFITYILYPVNVNIQVLGPFDPHKT